jgi:hypothetical protein
MVLNATFNNISVITWRSVLLVEETGVPAENRGFKTILRKKCRSGKNSEGPAENSWVLDLCPAK